MESDNRKEIISTLKKSRRWRQFKKQFHSDELLIVADIWCEMYEQFKGDIFATEEQQISDFITLQISMDRNTVEQGALDLDLQANTQELEYLRKMMKGKETKLIKDDLEQEQEAMCYHTALMTHRQVLKKDFTDLNRQKQDILQRLKGTREQRIKDVAEGKTSMIGFIREMQDKGIREDVAREVAMMNYAADQEHKRLTQSHIYEDNVEDRPFLIPEHIEKLTTRLEEDDVNLPHDLGEDDELARALVDYLTEDGRKKLKRILNGSKKETKKR